MVIPPAIAAITSTAIKIHSNGVTSPTPFGLIAGRIPEDLLEQTWRIGPEPVRSGLSAA